MPAFNHPQAALLRQLAHLITEMTGTTLGFLTEGVNAAGAWLAGAVPHRRGGGKLDAKIGLNARTVWQQNCKGYILLNFEPDLDCASAVQARKALKDASFVIAFSSYKTPFLEEVANVILPIAPFTETSGTYVNAMGEWQSFKAAASLYEGTQPAWKAISSMGNLLQLPGFQYKSSQEIRDELRSMVDSELKNKTIEYKSHKTFWHDVELPGLSTGQSPSSIPRIGDVPLYSVDSIVRRAKALQDTQKNN